jgi:hypothetical protein
MLPTHILIFTAKHQPLGYFSGSGSGVISDALTNNEIKTLKDKGNELYWPAVNELDEKIIDLSAYL